MLNWTLFIFVGTFGWGISLYLIKILLVTLTPTEIVLYRMGIGTLSLFILVKYLQLRTNHFFYLLRDGLIVGMFNMSLPFYLTALAEKNVSSSLASIINGLTPLFTFLLGILFFTTNQKLNFFNILGLIIGLIGIIVVNLDSTFNKNGIFDFLALIMTSLSYAISANYVKFYAKIKDPMLIAATAATFSTLIMLCCKLGDKSLHWNIPQGSSQIFAVLWLGIIGSGICLYLYCFLIQKMGATIASMITYLMTITGVGMGVIFLEEKIDGMILLGCVCIITSLVLVNHAHYINLQIRNFSIVKTHS